MMLSLQISTSLILCFLMNIMSSQPCPFNLRNTNKTCDCMKYGSAQGWTIHCNYTTQFDTLEGVQLRWNRTRLSKLIDRFVLTSIHKSIKKIPSDFFPSDGIIRNLDVSKNNLKDLKFLVPQADNLISLNLSHNWDLNISGNNWRFFQNMTQLEELRLEGINARDLNFLKRANSLSNLKKLYGGSNNLVSLPKDIFERTKNLRTINLRSSQIYDAQFLESRSLHNVSTLDLSRNSLREFGERHVRYLRSLKELNLENNNITKVPQSLFNALPRATKIGYAGNPLLCDCTDLWLEDWRKTHHEVLTGVDNLMNCIQRMKKSCPSVATTEEPEEPEDGLSETVIIAIIVVVCIIVLGIIVSVVVIAVCKRQQSNQRQEPKCVVVPNKYTQRTERDDYHVYDYATQLERPTPDDDYADIKTIYEGKPPARGKTPKDYENSRENIPLPPLPTEEGAQKEDTDNYIEIFASETTNLTDNDDTTRDYYSLKDTNDSNQYETK